MGVTTFSYIFSVEEQDGNECCAWHGHDSSVSITLSQCHYLPQLRQGRARQESRCVVPAKAHEKSNKPAGRGLLIEFLVLYHMLGVLRALRSTDRAPRTLARLSPLSPPHPVVLDKTNNLLSYNILRD